MSQNKLYTREEIRNKYVDKVGSEPLVIQFSLTNETRDSLQRELEPFVQGKHEYFNPGVLSDLADDKYVFDNDGDGLKLADIIRRYFPPEVLDYFENQDIKHPDKILPHVYVVKNLPEIKLEDATLERSKMYGSWIGEGFARAIGYSNKINNITRSLEHKEWAGQDLHKDYPDASGISGVYQNLGTTAKTRFTNLVSALKHHTGKAERTLDQRVLLGSGSRDFTDERLRKYGVTELDIDKYSNDVLIEKGDLVLWSEHGKVWHQAMPTQGTPQDDHSLLRYILTHAFEKNNAPSI